MADHLSQTFAALADPTRRRMLAQLSKGEASVSELAKPFLKRMSLPAVTKHLQVLEKARLITKTREAQWRPCKLNRDAFARRRRLDGTISPVLGRELRPARCLSENRHRQEVKRKENPMAAKAKSNEINITRVYDAPL